MSEVHQYAMGSVKYQPNIILINAGTNDARRHLNISAIGHRMNDMLNDLFEQIPGVTIILSTLLYSRHPEVEKDRPRVNAQYRDLVHARRHRLGQRIVLADMENPGTDYKFHDAHLPADPLDVHPSDEGYKIFGSVFLRSIWEAEEVGMIQRPNPTAWPDDATGT